LHSVLSCVHSSLTKETGAVQTANLPTVLTLLIYGALPSFEDPAGVPAYAVPGLKAFWEKYNKDLDPQRIEKVLKAKCKDKSMLWVWEAKVNPFFSSSLVSLSVPLLMFLFFSPYSSYSFPFSSFLFCLLFFLLPLLIHSQHEAKFKHQNLFFVLASLLRFEIANKSGQTSSKPEPAADQTRKLKSGILESSPKVNEAAPNQRFQVVFEDIRGLKERGEVPLDEKLKLNLRMEAVFEDLDENMRDVAKTIIRERYVKDVSFFFFSWREKFSFICFSVENLYW
jgi:hypothetical protein